jgi:excisionase family DNA binding protein
VLRLDRFLDDAGDGKSFERLLAVLQGVNRAGMDWESVCPASPAHRGLYIRIERVVEEHVPIAWCTAGCPDQVVLAALTERLRKPESQKAAPIEAPAPVPATAPLMGLTEAALMLNCHRRTVRAYLRAGVFPGRLLAGRWKIRREDLHAFIENAPAGSGKET